MKKKKKKLEFELPNLLSMIVLLYNSYSTKTRLDIIKIPHFRMKRDRYQWNTLMEHSCRSAATRQRWSSLTHLESQPHTQAMTSCRSLCSRSFPRCRLCWHPLPGQLTPLPLQDLLTLLALDRSEELLHLHCCSGSGLVWNNVLKTLFYRCNPFSL